MCSADNSVLNCKIWYENGNKKSNHLKKKEDIFERLEWLKTCFDAFSHTPRPPETFFQKRYFYRLEWLKTCFDAFSYTSRPPESCPLIRCFLTSGVVKDVF